MSQEITLQNLVEKVKTDLFSPYAGTGKAGKVAYPVLLVDSVELEIEIDLSYSAEAGLKISIPQVVESSVTGGQGKTATQKMKIVLSPVLTRDELRAEMEKDKRLMDGIKEASLLALRKGSKLEGEEE